jgi:hypothetical protein
VVYRWNVVVAVLLVVVDQRHCYHHVPTVKPEATIAVYKLLMMGKKMLEHMLSCI